MASDDDLLAEIAQYRASIDNIERLIKERKGTPQEHPNPLFKGIGGYPSGGRPAGQMSPPPPGSAPGMPAFPRAAVMGVQREPIPPVTVSATLNFIEHWKEILFKPEMASAMLYVILPVITKVIGLHTEIMSGGTTTSWDQLSAAIGELSTWEQLTIAQRSALEGLFTWVGQQLDVEHSVIPMPILSNMAAASEDYE